VDDVPAFSDEFRRELAVLKHMRWAADLTREQLLVALWAVGELGGRAKVILECLGRHEDELFPGYGYPRARVGLQVLYRMTHGERPTADEVTQLIEAARVEMEQWPGKHQNDL
jgi:hypothetical protein